MLSKLTEVGQIGVSGVHAQSPAVREIGAGNGHATVHLQRTVAWTAWEMNWNGIIARL